jgi:hypothetical protein
VDKYPSPIPQLQTAVKDAHAIADLLTDADATRAGILDQIATCE